MSTRLDVIIPAWNARRHLGEAIDSVHAQRQPLLLSGVCVTIDVVVVDDGSTDDTTAVARAHGARVVTQANAGVAAARNRGLADSDAELVAFLDADDLWTPGRLVPQLRALAEDPDALVLGLVEEFTSPDIPPERARQLAPKPGRLPAFVAGGLVCRRATFDRVGPFDTSLAVGEMVVWFQRSRALGIRERVLPELVLLRRLHGDNLTLRDASRRSDYVAMARALLARKRSRAES